MRTCDRCEAPLRDSDRFCGSCGASVEPVSGPATEPDDGATIKRSDLPVPDDHAAPPAAGGLITAVPGPNDAAPLSATRSRTDSAPTPGHADGTPPFDQMRRDRRMDRQTMLAIGGLAVIVLILVVGGIALLTGGDDDSADPASSEATPTTEPNETPTSDAATTPTTAADPTTTVAPTTTLPPAPPLTTLSGVRLLDTRPDGETVDGEQLGLRRREAGEVTVVNVAGRGAIPDDAVAVEVSLVAVNPGGAGFLTAYPCDVERPVASNLNYGDRQTTSGGAFVRLGDDGTICVFTARPAGLIVDATAFSVDEASIAPVTPARLVDSRADQPTVDGETSGIGRLTAEQVVVVPVAGRAGVADDATAVSINVVAVDPEADGFVVAYPCDEERPITSTVNYTGGQTTSGRATVGIADDGTICVFSLRPVDLIVDVSAFVPSTSSFTPITPARLADTRPRQPTVDELESGLGRRAAQEVTEVQVLGRGGVPLDASAASISVVAIQPEAAGFLTMYPCDEERPATSTVNYAAGQTTAGSATVTIGESGTICVFTLQPTDLVVDITAFIP